GRKQPLHVRPVEHLREGGPQARRFEPRRGAVRDETRRGEPGVERAHRDEPSRDRARGAAVGAEPAQDAGEVLIADVLEVALLAQGRAEEPKVAPVRRKRQRGEPALGGEMVEPALLDRHSRKVTGPSLTSSTSIIAPNVP